MLGADKAGLKNGAKELINIPERCMYRGGEVGARGEFKCERDAYNRK